MENVVIHCIDEGYLDAKLDQQRRVLDVLHCRVFRDIDTDMQAVDDAIAVLRAWSTRCSAVREQLSKQIKLLNDHLVKNVADDIVMR